MENKENPQNPGAMTRRGLLGTALTGVALSGCGGQRPTPKATGPDPFGSPVHFEHAGDLRTGDLRDMALGPDGSVFTCGCDGVSRYHRNGERLSLWKSAETCRAMAVGQDGVVWVAGAASVFSFTPEGRERGRFSIEGGEIRRRPLITSIAISGSFILLADAACRAVHRFAVNGDFVNHIGKDYHSGRGLVIPSPYFSVALAADETLFLGHTGSHRVEHYTQGGDLLDHWGERGMGPGRFSGCCNPVGLTVTAQGDFITAEKGLGRVSLFSKSGEILSLIGPGMISKKSRTLRVLQDEEGSVLVADTMERKIRIFKGLDGGIHGKG